MIPRWLLGLTGAGVVAALATATYWVLEMDGPPAVTSATVAGLLLALSLVTLAFLSLRWLRWHYLVRRFTHAVRARDSLVLYAATLPALLTPFALGELIRVYALRRRAPGATKYLVLVWFLERFVDLSFVIALSLVRSHWALAAAALGAAAASLVFAHLWITRRRRTSLFGFAPGVFVLSALQWMLPVLALWFVLRQLGGPAPLAGSASALGWALLRGGLSGLPMGAGVTSSSLILEIRNLGASESLAIVAGAVFRIGTAWFAAVLGFALLAAFRRPFSEMFRGPVAVDHFDTIASAYEGLIPEHVRDRLLLRKVGAMTRVLEREGCASGSKGLDVGCGQGSYVIELSKRGFRMSGVEASHGQLDVALTRVERADVGIDLRRGSAEALPFADAYFDFVYLINVIHHIPGSGNRARALAECIRVLRPGGILFLHEINTHNPLFRFYMGYVFPFLRKIDDGTEEWILPSALPEVPGHHWSGDVVYFTFLPEFVPVRLLHSFTGLERWLERSSLRRYSAHFMAFLTKEEPIGDRRGALAPAGEVVQP